MISRSEAKASGQKFYSSTCARCGDCTRRVDSGSCCSCAKTRRKRVYHEAKLVDCGLLIDKHCTTCGCFTSHYASNGNCKRCSNKRSLEHYSENRDFYMEKFKLSYAKNTEQRKAKNREWYQNNKGRLSSYFKAYRANNAEKIKAWRSTESAMSAHRKRQGEKYKTPEGKVVMAARNMVYRVMTGERCGAASSLLGYSTPELVAHISSLFCDGMSWDNYGDWHIDHVVPLSFLVKNNVTDVAVINSLKNLRPLWAAENISKHAKYEGTLLDALRFLGVT